MKIVLITVCLAILMLLGALIYVFAPVMRAGIESDSRSESGPPDQPSSNITFNKSYSLTAKQRLALKNNQFRRISIRSQFAISVSNGQCRQRNVAEFECRNDEPFDIFIVDSRPALALLNPSANAVTVSGSQY